jgi:hypothetical protein
MLARLSAFVIWSLVAASAVFWLLRLAARPPQVPGVFTINWPISMPYDCYAFEHRASEVSRNYAARVTSASSHDAASTCRIRFFPC